MSQYKLHYFNVMSRGELIRYIFAVANVKYEEERIEFDQWTSHKTKFRFQQVPVLELEGGVQLFQSVAIAQFLARKFGLAGKSEVEQALSTAVVEQTKDLIDCVVGIYMFEPDVERKKVRTQDFQGGLLKTTLDGFEAHLQQNASGYIVGDSLTWADLAVHSVWPIVVGFVDISEDVLSGYPALQAHRDKVGSVEALRTYLANRPKTKF